LLAGCSSAQAPVVDGNRSSRPIPTNAAPPAAPEAGVPAALAGPAPQPAADAAIGTSAEAAVDAACNPSVKSPVDASAVRVEKTPTSPCKRRPVQGALRDVPDYLREYECRGPAGITLGVASEDERVFFTLQRPTTGTKIELQPLSTGAFTSVHGPARWYSRDKQGPEVVVLEIRGSYTADDKQVTFTTIGAWRTDSGVLCRSANHDAKRDSPVDAVAVKLATEVLGGGCDCPAK
jgi:hypothetical protein